MNEEEKKRLSESEVVGDESSEASSEVANEPEPQAETEAVPLIPRVQAHQSPQAHQAHRNHRVLQALQAPQSRRAK